MKINSFEKFIGTGFYSGYSPFAPGTAGSAVAYLIYLIPGFASYYILLPSIVISLFYGAYIGSKFENRYGKDPSIFTLDEFAGSWIALLFIPDKYFMIIASFFLWRLLDILKPFPANRFEKITGGWGIVLDDAVSGVYALIVMFIIENIFF